MTEPTEIDPVPERPKQETIDEYVVRSNRDDEIVIRCGEDAEMAASEAARLNDEQRTYRAELPINADALNKQGVDATRPTTYRVEVVQAPAAGDDVEEA